MRRQKREKSLFEEIMVENFPNLGEWEEENQIQELQRTPNKIKSKTHSGTHYN